MPEGIPAEGKLLSRIDGLLSHGNYDADIRSRAMISLQFGELIKNSLDSLQLRALEVAKQYWDGPSPSEKDRLQLLTEMAHRCDQDVHEGRDRERHGYANRLIWNALNANTGLDGLAAQLLVEIAIGVGLKGDQIEQVFSQVVPKGTAFESR